MERKEKKTPEVNPDEVLRRMLNTPPPRKKTATKKKSPLSKRAFLWEIEMTSKVKLEADFSECLGLLDEAQSLQVSKGVVHRFLSGFDSGKEIGRFKTDVLPALVADNHVVRVRLEPSDGLRRFVAALRTRDGDALIVKVGH